MAEITRHATEGENKYNLTAWYRLIEYVTSRIHDNVP